MVRRCLQVLGSQGLLEAALQATLTCDAIALRFQLPPYGTPAPDGLEDPMIARGTLCTPTMLVTSVWVVSVLRTIAKRPDHRLLAALGVGAVSAQPVQGFSDDDAARYQMLERQQPLLSCIPLVRAQTGWVYAVYRRCCRMCVSLKAFSGITQAPVEVCVRNALKARCRWNGRARMVTTVCTCSDHARTRADISYPQPSNSHADLILALQPSERPARVAVGHERRDARAQAGPQEQVRPRRLGARDQV